MGCYSYANQGAYCLTSLFALHCSFCHQYLGGFLVCTHLAKRLDTLAKLMPTPNFVASILIERCHMKPLQRSTTEEAREAKRLRLLHAATKLFSQRGFHETKMQDIADEANVGKGTLYEYFETKEDLFFAVYESWIHEYEMEMERQAQAHLDPVSKASALIDTTVAFYERHAAHAAILLEFWAHAIRSQNVRFLNRIRQMKARLAKLGGQVTKELIALKLFVDVDVDSFTRLELAMSDGVFLQWILDGQSYSLRDAYKFRQSLIGAGLMTDALRKVVASKTEKRLRQGFLRPDATSHEKRRK
ncbi:MAG: TetR/AcrR family transcriptional regulator [Candidatus Thermochlorobacter aerophilum]|uniref:TetR/AcrR family transcriptional regulator n=1 Tax=Candidatus Thermochlorobacter aerophilus TaxID=1868324 RepID=A0A395LXV3_9BACT|nr:MAG: TetR/AcrR family transcriptional regulator [Candidatus Thermochlorobacter aerophilum]